MSESDLAADSAMDARLRRHGDALRAERDGCPHPDLLFARRSETFDAGLRERLEQHVSTCEACRRLAEDFDGLGLAEADAAVEARVLTRVAHPAGHGRAGWLSLAAGLVVASGLGVAWWHARSPAPAPRSSAATQAPPAVPAPLPVVALWTVTPAPVRVPLSLGVSRGGGPAPLPDGAVLVEALAPYQQGDYAAAVGRLAAVVRDHPESGEAHFYLGVAHLMAGDPDQALVSFDEASSRLPATRRAEAEWYRATAEQRAGRPGAARARLHVLCAQPGNYQAQACAAEASLK